MIDTRDKKQAMKPRLNHEPIKNPSICIKGDEELKLTQEELYFSIKRKYTALIKRACNLQSSNLLLEEFIKKLNFIKHGYHELKRFIDINLDSKEYRLIITKYLDCKRSVICLSKVIEKLEEKIELDFGFSLSDDEKMEYKHSARNIAELKNVGKRLMFEKDYSLFEFPVLSYRSIHNKNKPSLNFYDHKKDPEGDYEAYWGIWDKE